MDNTLTLLKALSDRNRLRIVLALTQYEELCACQITELLQVRGATASRHLSQLTGCGLLQDRKEGRWVWFRLLEANRHQPLLHWLHSNTAASAEYRHDKQRLKQITAMDPAALCRQQRGETCCPSESLPL
ncbi:MAG TPA: metalloregulator ArsR/SmtB family transcription factor [Pseudomonadales bacterium]|jgi:ArsR family transcriptional regulator